jgi:uncharacterized protein YjhX (UPF0386 family)
MSIEFLKELGIYYTTYDKSFKLIEFYISKERSKINPFKASFPFILWEDGLVLKISLASKLIADMVMERISNHLCSVEKLKEILESLLDCKTLEVDYYSKKHIYPNNGKNFDTISPSELALLNKQTSIEFETLKKNNDNGKVKIIKHKGSIAGVGLITREFDNLVEISITIFKKFRSKGLGFKLAQDMSNSILNSGRSISYIVETKNQNSKRIAQKLNFTHLANFYIGYQKRI